MKRNFFHEIHLLRNYYSQLFHEFHEFLFYAITFDTVNLSNRNQTSFHSIDYYFLTKVTGNSQKQTSTISYT